VDTGSREENAGGYGLNSDSTKAEKALERDEIRLSRLRIPKSGGF
jgi:hypothetical protein